MDPAIGAQLAGTLRILMPIALGYFVTRGYIPPDAVGPFTNAIAEAFTAAVTVFSLIWSWRAHRQVAQIQRVAAMPEVKAVVTTPNIAEVKLADDPKVVTVPK